MNRTAGFMAFFLLLTLPLLPALARAEGTETALKASDISVKLEGSSTLHGWEASAASVSITALCAEDQQGLFHALAAKGLHSLVLSLAVDSLKTTESSGMDRNLRKDLGAPETPEVRFNLKSYSLNGLSVTVQGDLEIHGTTQAVSLTGLLAKDGATLVLKGSYLLRMTDYGVKPPVMMLGTIRVADQVKVVYSFRLAD